MRTTLLLLLATISAPALAADPDEDRGGDRRQVRAERAQRAEPPARDERAERRAVREERRENPDRGFTAAAGRDAEVELQGRREQLGPRPEHAPRGVEAGERPAGYFDRAVERDARQADRAGRRFEREADSVAEADRPAPGPRLIEAPGSRRRTGDTVADWRIRDRGQGSTPELVQERDGSVPEAMRDRRQRQLERIARRGDPAGRSSPVTSVPREGTQPPAPTAQRTTRHTSSHWRGDWRRDHRYDWWNWRRKNRSRFHLGFYFDPFGWSYRRYSVGWRLWPQYYRSSYWLSDPWSYRLPYAPPGHRWIRYYDDALLVDTWDGRVVDVIHNFFW